MRVLIAGQSGVGSSAVGMFLLVSLNVTQNGRRISTALACRGKCHGLHSCLRLPLGCCNRDAAKAERQPPGVKRAFRDHLRLSQQAVSNVVAQI